jgi:Tubulin like
MEIQNALLYVGIGGSGHKIGTALELRLRRTVRGADGERPVGKESRQYLQYELPPCLQFVYVDLDEDEIRELRRQAAPLNGDHKLAVAKTARVAANLVPVQRSYPQVAQSLRTVADREVRHWLPPAIGEPNIAPLSRGAGQLPAIARACLFATMAGTGGIADAQRPIREAINALSGSGPALAALRGGGGGAVTACDVFVVFSLAGGTGTGLFYDYMHLIADAFEGSSIEIMIHPIVVMPSAFKPAQGGGRPAQLNAGRGLLDLARLVDDQIARAADVTYGADGTGLEHGLSVAYPGPGGKRIRIEPSTIQSAHLFSETNGLSETDLHRAIASFILTKAGVRQRSGGGGAEGPGISQSHDINSVVAKQSLAPSGVGGRSLSLAAVTSLSQPRGEVLDILGAHLLALAVSDDDLRHVGEDNEPLSTQFLNAAGLEALRLRRNEAHGRVRANLTDDALRQAMTEEIHDLRNVLSEQVPDLASAFNPWQGIRSVLTSPIPGHHGSVDLFRATRAIFGTTGAGGAGSGGQSPQTAERLLQERAVFRSMPDEPPAEDPHRWFAHKINMAWNQAWAAERAQWQPTLSTFRDTVVDLTDALRRHQLAEGPEVAQRVGDLFTERKVAPYYLPDLPHGPRDFCQELIRRLAGVLGTGEDPVVILTALLGPSFWADVVDDAQKLGAARAVARLRRAIDGAIWRFTRKGSLLIPQVADLLEAVAGTSVPGVSAKERDRFRNRLDGFILPGLLPEARGDVRVLLAYPIGPEEEDDQAAEFDDDPVPGQAVSQRDHGALAADAAGGAGLNAAAASLNGVEAGPAGGYVLPTRKPQVEERLESTIRDQIGRQPGRVDFEFNPTREESLTVVLTRVALGVTDVPEAMEVLRYWHAAVIKPHREDYLRWRQRLGYHYEWLLTTPEQRVDILHQLMIAMRNGQVEVVKGTQDKPAQIEIRIRADADANVTRLALDLTGFGPASPWGSLLTAYELSILGGTELSRQEMYTALMNVAPEITLSEDGLSCVSDPLYQGFLGTAKKQVTVLTAIRDALRQRSPGQPSAQLRHVEMLLNFWKATVPSAWMKPLTAQFREGGSLRELDEGLRGLAHLFPAEDLGDDVLGASVPE